MVQRYRVLAISLPDVDSQVKIHMIEFVIISRHNHVRGIIEIPVYKPDHTGRPCPQLSLFRVREVALGQKPPHRLANHYLSD
jgi:hypothetical protein